MAQPYVGEIRMFAGNFAPAGWMFCAGQLLPISEYETLFSSPYQAASRGYIDAVIQPRETRPWLIKALDTARTKRVNTPARKHGNIPL